jgi:hypothetical protein
MLNVSASGQPFTSSGGGPIIVLPAETASQWRGTLPPLSAVVPDGWSWGKSGGPVCDYDRACDQPQGFHRTEQGGFGWLDVGGKPALVLDGEIHTVFVQSSTGGFIVRNPASSESEVEVADTREWRPGPIAELALEDGRLFMFDSAFQGHSDPLQIAAHDGVGVIQLLPGGVYQVHTATVDGEDYLRLALKGAEG